jgi:hypothetical protein
MLVKNVTRGNIVTFTATFYDANNAVAEPSDPVLRVYFRSNDDYITTLANMSSNGTSWTAIWDSSNADVGIVQWYINSGNGIAEEGEFRVNGNHASNTSNPT